MKIEFYKDKIENQPSHTDFQTEQTEFQEQANIIEDIQNKYKIYIDYYLERDKKESTKISLFDLIDANWDQKKVINYLEFKKRNENISKDDLSQINSLKSILEKQDYNEKIHMFPNNVNFWIVDWYYEINWKKYQLIKKEIKKLRKNRYKLILQKEWSKLTEKFQIHYDWSDFVSIYNQFWMYIWRENLNKWNTIFIEWNKYRKEQYQTSWKLEINSLWKTIHLNLVFID